LILEEFVLFWKPRLVLLSLGVKIAVQFFSFCIRVGTPLKCPQFNLIKSLLKKKITMDLSEVRPTLSF